MPLLCHNNVTQTWPGLTLSSQLQQHILLAILLGTADQSGSRREVLSTLLDGLRGHGIFCRSSEDLTPLRLDPPCLIPLGVVSARLLLSPRAARRIATGAVNAYSLTEATVEAIMACDERWINLRRDGLCLSRG